MCRQSMTLIGQYDVWVRKGAINIAGAVLHASSRLHRIYAPSTHSLPSIRPIPNPYGPQNLPTEITVISCTSRIRLLKQLSPKFGRIWNRKHVFAVKTNPLTVNRSQRSFAFVSLVCFFEDVKMLIVIYSSSLQQTIHTKDLCTSLSHRLIGE